MVRPNDRREGCMAETTINCGFLMVRDGRRCAGAVEHDSWVFMVAERVAAWSYKVADAMLASPPAMSWHT